jgi:hypothetical protein
MNLAIKRYNRPATTILISLMWLNDWKQWNQPRTRRRHLLALGADPDTVHMATRSRKGYWRMSQNEIVSYALNNRWLEEQGVPDMNAPVALATLEIREA